MTSNKKGKPKGISTNENSQLLLLDDDEVGEGPEVGKGAGTVAGPDCVDHARVVGSRHQRQRGLLQVLDLHLEEHGEVEASRRDSYSYSDSHRRRDLRQRGGLSRTMRPGRPALPRKPHAEVAARGRAGKRGSARPGMGGCCAPWAAWGGPPSSLEMGGNCH